MGAVAAAGSTGTQEYENVDSGTYAARCIVVAELGTFENNHPQAKPGDTKREILLGFELSELMQDGLPFVVSWRGTNSLGERATLYKMLSAWRGKPFTNAELSHFEMKNILDKTCLVNVVSTPNKAGKIWSKVAGIMPLPKGMQCADRVNPLVDFGIQEIEKGDWEHLWPWVQKTILGSHEGIAYQKEHGNIATGAKEAQQTSDTFEDGTAVPF
jgi:hypothetical protein